MKLRMIEVTDKQGEATSAALAVCDCGCETFNVYHVIICTGAHLHLQCSACGVSHCDGTCALEGEAGDGQTHQY